MRHGRAKEAGPIGKAVIGSIIVVLGYLGTFTWAGGQYAKAEQARSWPTTRGVIEVSEVIQSKNSDGDRMYSADIVYAYKVEEQSYEGSEVTFGGNYKSGDRSQWTRLANQYPVGSEVEVHYDPEVPGISVLQPDVAGFIGWVWIGGWVFMAIGLLIAISGFWSIAKILLFGGAAIAALATED